MVQQHGEYMGTAQNKKISIDSKVCTQCGACVTACATKALEFGGDGFPFLIEGSCVHCGGCVGICPVFAVGYD